jgi:hypothetical protein
MRPACFLPVSFDGQADRSAQGGKRPGRSFYFLPIFILARFRLFVKYRQIGKKAYDCKEAKTRRK